MKAKEKKTDPRKNNTMNDALRRKYEKLCEHRLKGTLGDVDAKYQVAAIVHQIKSDPDTYGGRGVELLAKALRVDKSLLYREAKVAEVWKLPEVKELAAASTGGLISWTHLVMIAEVDDEDKRKAAIKAIVDKGLSVAGLRKHLHPPVEKPKDSPLSVGVCLSRATAKIEGFRSQYNLVAKDLADSLAGVDPKTLALDDCKQANRLLVLIGEVMTELNATFLSVRGVDEVPGANPDPAVEEPQPAAPA